MVLFGLYVEGWCVQVTLLGVSVILRPWLVALDVEWHWPWLFNEQWTLGKKVE